jgi:hypothetical protein
MTGTNYDATLSLNRLALNTALVGATSGTATSLGWTVPGGVASGRVRVTTPAGTVLSADDFFVPPSPYTASDVVATARLVVGQVTNLAIGTANKVALAVFDGTAGQRVSLKVVPGPLSTVTLYRPTQTVLKQQGITVGTNLVEPPLLPAAGTYQWLLDPTGSATGTTALTLYDVPADVSATITTDGTPVNVATSVPGQNGVLTFTGAQNQRVSVRTAPSAPLGTVSLRRPDGTVQASVGSGPASAFLEPQTLATTGTYSLLVDPTGAATGTTTVNLYVVPADVQDTIAIGGSTVGVTLSAPGQNGSLTFSGTSGQPVTVRLTSNTIGFGGFRGATTVKLLKPDGTQLTSTISNAISFTLATQTLPVTGTYTIVIDPSSVNYGGITVQVTTP